MAKPPHTGGEMGGLYLICWRRNYPQDRGTRPAGGLRCRDTHPPRLTLLEPLHGANPERLGPTKGRTITLLAQLRSKRVNGRNLFREHPYLYGQFHSTAESSWWWGHISRLLSVLPC